jgi:glucose/arabinose dehydrogenase
MQTADSENGMTPLLQTLRPASRLIAASLSLAAILGAAVPGFAEDGNAAAPAAQNRSCAEDNGGLTLPEGFCATIFADGLGHARHLVVAADGTVYVNARHVKRSSSGSLVALKDTKGDGKADVIQAFGDPQGGGTGIALYKNWLYAENKDRIVRYALTEGDAVPKDEPETVISGLPLNGNHVAHPFAIDAEGNLFVNLGSATNSCQKEDRIAGSPGLDPCEELKTRGGIWRYDANKTNQTFSPSERYATGLRNAVGIDVDAAGRTFATQHGRDQLYENWPNLYSSERGTELPAEELVLLKQGGDYGWPFCYFDGDQQKRVLAPEYDGDGGKAVGLCNEKLPPVAAFPAHWAPNDVKVYNGSQFPQAYHGGAFIAFHGSWNRSSGPQGGYNVVFQPLADGKASGKYTIFADGFAGEGGTNAAEHRPTGLAVGPDGALYVSDDAGGRIWRIVYKG